MSDNNDRNDERNAAVIEKLMADLRKRLNPTVDEGYVAGMLADAISRTFQVTDEERMTAAQKEIVQVVTKYAQDGNEVLAIVCAFMGSAAVTMHPMIVEQQEGRNPPDSIKPVIAFLTKVGPDVLLKGMCLAALRILRESAKDETGEPFNIGQPMPQDRPQEP